ncbi:hypothetical protein BGZ49_006567 [Haplosporangium sp. Z 27]|nr:hypothetical protein BGZ49_006567 [Haplosporangium sp. Z 27]
MLEHHSEKIGFEMELISDWLETVGVAPNPLSKLSKQETSVATPVQFSLPALPKMPARASLTASRTQDLIRESTSQEPSQTNSYQSSSTASWSSWFWSNLGYTIEPEITA